jgi:hypothetical protein
MEAGEISIGEANSNFIVSNLSLKLVTFQLVIFTFDRFKQLPSFYQTRDQHKCPY